MTLIPQMLSRIWSLLFLLLLAGCQGNVFRSSESNGVVRNGVVDLHDSPLAKPLALNGAWNFSWNQLRSPTEPCSTLTESELLQVPGSWNGASPGHRSGSGFGTYCITILNPPPDLALSLNHVRTSYVLYANGKRIASNGVVGTRASSSVPQFNPQVVTLGSYGTHIDLVLHIANYLHRDGGLSEEVFIGPLKELNAARDNALSLDALIVGALMMFGFYHLALFILHRETTALYFMGYYMFFAIRLATRHSLLIMNVFPNLGAEILLRLEYAGVFGISFYTISHVKQFPQIVPKVPVYIYIAFNTLLLIAGSVLPAPSFTYTALLWEASAVFAIFMFFYFAMICAIRGVADSRLYLFVHGLIFIGIVNEILNSVGVIHSFPLLMWTAFIALALQSLMLSRNFVQAVDSARIISSELEVQLQRDREMRKIHLRLQGMLDKLPSAVAATNEEGELIYGNQVFYSAYGRADQLLHKPIASVLSVMGSEESVIGALGESISKSVMEMGDELLWLYLVTWPGKSEGAHSASELVAGLQQSRVRLQKISRNVALSTLPQVSTELEQLESALSQTVLNINSDVLVRKRIIATALMQAALSYWIELTEKSKFDLARESRLWTVDISADGWLRTRTLDKYLHTSSLPRFPRWDRVIQTVEYVLSESPKELPQRSKIIDLLEEFRNLD